MRAMQRSCVAAPGRNGSAWHVLLLALAVFCCSAPSVHAALPVDLTNFQNEYPCVPNATLIVRPETLDDVVKAVALHDKVMSSGAGHSWNQVQAVAADSVVLEPLPLHH
eukprot:GHUV01052568.1.p1 GENE.GHUV01052568.1~~GHUV01052568.1.p1  ORF type:complete len:109 (+),score=18.54 GHUV01052568.1:459-785(+)